MNSKKGACLTAISLTAMAVIGVALAGCSTTPPTAPAGDSAASTQKKVAAGVAGPQLWAQNCGRCHNIRSPNSYSDAQWDVVLLHMRVRANLTAEEHKQILAFMKSAH